MDSEMWAQASARAAAAGTTVPSCSRQDFALDVASQVRAWIWGKGEAVLSILLLLFAYAFTVSPQGALASCRDPVGECDDAGAPADFAELSLEDMLNVVVTSVTKEPEKLRETAAAIYVLTGEEIRESGATNLGDALRIVPGLDVAQIDGSRYAISARGLHAYYAKKMLVLIDGRSVYTPLFAATAWEQLDPLLDNIDRIEIIRGPGGTTWGANAVNGVINIITKPARDTTGPLLRQSGGTDGYSHSAGRWGGKLGKSLWYRGDVQYIRDNGVGQVSGGHDVHDGRFFTRGAFRVDWQPEGPTKVSAQGEYVDGEVDQPNVLALGAGAPKWKFHDETRTGYFLVRADHDLDRWGTAFLQSYYDRAYRNANVVGRFRDDIGTFDLEFQHHLPVFPDNEATWALAYRWYDFNIGSGQNISFGDVGSETIVAARIEDEWWLLDNFKIGAGTKIENNSFTGTELSPRIHAAYLATASHTLWASISRAVRTPGLLQNSLVLKNAGMRIDPETGARTIFTFKGTSALKSEKLIAYETGWRARLGKRAELDLALFFNDYADAEDFGAVLGERTVLPTIPPTILQDLDTASVDAGYSFGGEILWRVQLTPWWHAELSYALEKFKDTVDARDPNMPDHKVNLRQQFLLPLGLQATASLHWVDRIQIRSEGGRLEKIDPYTRVDLAVRRWCWDDRLLLEIVGQNLIEGKHEEFFEQFQTGDPVALGRRIWGGVSFRY